MERFAPEQETYWVIQPLVDAGLDIDEIRDLVSRLGFEVVVGEGPGVDARVRDLVGEHPVDVQAAWVETISRMIAMQLPGR